MTAQRITIPLDLALGILAAREAPIELVAEGSGVFVTLTVQLQGDTPRTSAPAEPKRQRAAPAADEFACSDCPEKFRTPQGLGAHRRYQHPKVTSHTNGASQTPPTLTEPLAS